MNRDPFFSRALLSQLLLRTVTVILLGAAATAHATTDGPAISGTPLTQAVMGQTYSFTPTVSNPAKLPLRFNIYNKPAWATFNTSTGHLSGIPAAASVGTQSYVTIFATDGVLRVSLPAFTLTVIAPAADKPVLSGAPPTQATMGQTYSFTPTVSNPAKLPLRFNIYNKPAWATFNTSTGHLGGVPAAASVGTQSYVAIFATDGVLRVSLPAFTLTVIAPAADKPVLSGAPLTHATMGQTYSFTPTVSNPAKLPLRFNIYNKPAWATFNTSTGHLGGIPAAASVGTQSYVTIFATDGVLRVSLPAFTLKVIAGTSTADKPVISGSPLTSVTAGSTYKFQPAAKDPDGKTLSFSVQNKPSWASFSISSGLLDGTPTRSQSGTYGNIIISASNGQYSSALPAFSVTVNNAVTSSTGTATLHWVVPTENTNGTALTDLAGVRIYYGTSASNLSQMVQMASTSQTSYTVSNLTAGVWYFASRAYTTTGVQSALSSVVSKSIP